MQWNIIYKPCPFTVGVDAPGKEVGDIPVREDVVEKFIVFDGFSVYWT